MTWPCTGNAVQRELPADQAGERLHRRLGGHDARMGAEHGDAGRDAVVALRLGADHRRVDAAGSALEDLAVLVDEEVVAEVVPAVGVAVVAGDAEHDPGGLLRRVVVRRDRVVHERGLDRAVLGGRARRHGVAAPLAAGDHAHRRGRPPGADGPRRARGGAGARRRGARRSRSAARARSGRAARAGCRAGAAGTRRRRRRRRGRCRRSRGRRRARGRPSRAARPTCVQRPPRRRARTCASARLPRAQRRPTRSKRRGARSTRVVRQPAPAADAVSGSSARSSSNSARRPARAVVGDLSEAAAKAAAPRPKTWRRVVRRSGTDSRTPHGPERTGGTLAQGARFHCGCSPRGRNPRAGGGAYVQSGQEPCRTTSWAPTS